MHTDSLPAKAVLLGGCTFASSNYLLSCEDDDIDAHNDNKSNTENSQNSFRLIGSKAHL